MWSLDVGGAQRAVYQLVREQRRRGMTADVALATDLGVYGERVLQTGATVHQLGCRGAWDAVRSNRLTSIARHYSLVHVHSIEPLLIGAVARAGSTAVYTHRGGRRDHGWKKRARLAVARPLVRRFDAISANTRQSARVVAEWLGLRPDDVWIAYNGLDFSLLEPSRPREDVLSELSLSGDARIVGTAAKLQPLKRVDVLLHALAAATCDVRCVVLGDGPSRQALERLALQLGVADRVTFIGRREAVGDYLQILDVFVLPSGPEEAFGNAAVEAMGMGVPTIVFADGGGLTEHVTDRETGRVVIDAAGLAEAINELARDADQRRMLGQRGRKHVRATYSLDAMFERYDRLYRAALSSTS
jgi:glycosyltransferase involved in cell wall biosynthesis